MSGAFEESLAGMGIKEEQAAAISGKPLGLGLLCGGTGNRCHGHYGPGFLEPGR